jgi:hypothetical protein
MDRERTFTTDEMAQAFLDYGSDMLRALMAGGMAAILAISGDTIKRELNFPKSGPPAFPGLRRQTGTLQRSVAASPYVVERSATEAEAGFGTSVPYGVNFEQGFEGTVSVRAHTRTSDVAFGRKVKPYTAFVRAHDRFMDVRPRRYMARTLAADSEMADRLIDRSLWMLFASGRAPSVEEVRKGAA